VAVERGDRDVSLRVTDTGIGMTPKMVAHAFDLFTQEERSLDRAQGGLGIGLTLVRWLVDMHGGTVTAHSEGPGKGSTFVVHLPLPEPAAGTDAPGAATPVARPREACRNRILVVDDNVDAAESLAILLRLGGHETRTAHDGPSALEAAGEFLPEVVLLDLGLPGMDGYEVAKRLRQRPETERALLVAVTGYGQEEYRKRAREGGFDHHLVKPVHLSQLEELLVTRATV
jgi:two-component system CheB/CheR fusion protein